MPCAPPLVQVVAPKQAYSRDGTKAGGKKKRGRGKKKGGGKGGGGGGESKQAPVNVDPNDPMSQELKIFIDAFDDLAESTKVGKARRA